MSNDKHVTPDRLMEISTAPWMARILTVAIKLDLFSHIDSGANTFQDIRRLTEIPERPLNAMLTALLGMDLIIRQEDHYHNQPISDAFLVKGKPAFFGDMILMQGTRIYNLFTKLEKSVQTDKPPMDIGKSVKKSPALADTFTSAMHNNAIGPARALAAKVDFGEFNHLLDVGGGSGAYSIILANHFPKLFATIFEFETVGNVAKRYVDSHELQGRVSIISGDILLHDTFPSGFDVALLSQVLHQYGPEDSKLILKNIYDVLPSGGMLVINEFFLNDDKTGPLFASLFSVLMVLESEKGTSYSKPEVTTWLSEVGFYKVKGDNLLGPHSYLTARKP